MVEYNFSSDTSTSSTASASSCWKYKLFIAYTAASLPDLCLARTWSKPLYSSISCFVTFVKHFPIILITLPTPIGLTSLLPLSSGIRWLARIGSMVARSMYSAHSQQVRAVKASAHKLEPDFLNDLLARVLWKPFVSTFRGPAAPLYVDYDNSNTNNNNNNNQLYLSRVTEQ